jgi:hypothetical protein
VVIDPHRRDVLGQVAEGVGRLGQRLVVAVDPGAVFHRLLDLLPDVCDPVVAIRPAP